MPTEVLPEPHRIVAPHGIDDAASHHERVAPCRHAWQVLEDGARRLWIQTVEVMKDRSENGVLHAKRDAVEIGPRPEHRFQLLEAVPERRLLGIRSRATGGVEELPRLGECRFPELDPAPLAGTASASRGYIGAPPCDSLRYSQITMLSKIKVAVPSCWRTRSSGTLPFCDMSRNQSGLAARSMLILSKGTPFSSKTIAARWTKGHSRWLMRVMGVSVMKLFQSGAAVATVVDAPHMLRHQRLSRRPPSTTISEPTVQRDSSDARYCTALVTSSDVPKRPSGMVAAMSLLTCSR